MIRKYVYIFCFITIVCRAFEIRNLSQYVDPRNGTESPGNTVIGPQMPWGSINPSPETLGGRTDGYTAKNPIRGFGQLHVHGTGGLSRYGNFLLSPQVGLEIIEENHESKKSNEVVKCGYYGVTLDRYQIRTEVTAAHHAAIYKMTFPESDDAHILLDLSHYLPRHLNGNTGSGITKGEIQIDADANTISGWGKYHGGWTGWAPWHPFNVYFFAEVSKKPEGYGTWKDTMISTDSSQEIVSKDYEQVGAYVKYNTKSDEVIYLKIAVSMRSIENAKKFLYAEIPDFNFDSVYNACTAAWDKNLSAILINDKHATRDQLTIFYSNLYHAMVMPRDRTGDDPWNTGLPYWDDQYCGWDTYRTLFPLWALIRESVVADNVNSFIHRFERTDCYVSDAFIAGKTCGAQGGDNNDVIIADAFVKGIPGVDWDKAYNVLHYHATQVREEYYRENDRGWVPSNCMTLNAASRRIPRDCSRTLEFAFNDFCVAQVAKGLGKDRDYERFLKRSRQWENLWDINTEDEGFKGFIRPKDSDGNWTTFNTTERGRWNSHFYEGTSWQYSYYVPHDYDRLIKLMGGKEKFLKRLNYYFDKNMHSWSNQPTFLNARLYNYIGRPDLTSITVRKGMEEWQDGIPPGNDDSGAMGSWYVFSVLGFFPVAGEDVYLINGPLFEDVSIQMENGKTVEIKAKHASPETPYIQSAKLHGKNLGQSWFRHTDIGHGGKIEFIMGDKPSKWAQEGTLPPSLEAIIK